MAWKECNIEEMSFNPFTLLGNEWALVTAGTKEKYNTMTVSWGGVGVFWNKNVATIYIRPQRYTKEFVDSNDNFTVSFYNKEYKSALGLCGRVSGRDVDKVKETGLTPVFQEDAPYFEEAKLVLVCRKLYHMDMAKGSFDAPEYDGKIYPEKDYHIMYVAEIEKVLVNE